MPFFEDYFFENGVNGDPYFAQMYNDERTFPNISLNPQADEFYPGPEEFGYDPYAQRFRHERSRMAYYEQMKLNGSAEKYRQPHPEEIIRPRYPPRSLRRPRARLPLNFPPMHVRPMQHAQHTRIPASSLPAPPFSYYERSAVPPVMPRLPQVQQQNLQQRGRNRPPRIPSRNNLPKYPMKKRTVVNRSGQRKYSYRSKQDKIDEVLGRLRYKYDEQGKLSEQSEVLRGEDTLRIDVKRYTALQQIESVIDKIERDPKTELLRVDFPVSQKNRFQKKGFIAYLKCGSNQQAEHLREKLVRIKDPKYPEKCLFRVTVAVELRRDLDELENSSDRKSEAEESDENESKQTEGHSDVRREPVDALCQSFKKFILDSKTTEL